MQYQHNKALIMINFLNPLNTVTTHQNFTSTCTVEILRTVNFIQQVAINKPLTLLRKLQHYYTGFDKIAI